MATLALQTVGSVLSQNFTNPLSSITSQSQNQILNLNLDSSLFPTSSHKVQSSRVANLSGLISQEGGFIPRVYGRARIGGQLIWTTRFEEHATLARSGAIGGKGMSSTAQPTSDFVYYGNFAIAICEGPISFIRRIWADGQELDLSLYTYRLYKGTDDQTADALISAKEGADQTPSYKGTAYIVFEQFPLKSFGNRIPQFSFEVIKSINGLAQHIQSIHVIPATTEYGYATQALIQNINLGVTQSENRHNLSHLTDWQASLDALQALCPNLKHVSLVVSWFGNDLRADQCQIQPRIENSTKSVPDMEWRIGSYTRFSAPEVSQISGRPAYGGSPCDQSVMQAISDLSQRGFSITFYPFVMMDIANGNILPDPVTGSIGQTAYPWRGKITLNTQSHLSARQQIEQFFNGTQGDGFRDFILHYAHLCAQSTAIDCFIIGSELIGLSRLSEQDHSFPFAFYLLQLLKEVRQILGSKCKLSYGADWTEYGAYVDPQSQNVYFPLDYFWSDSDVDFIGLDVYWPLTDWRDNYCFDAQDFSSIYDKHYLASRFNHGEAFDWYYASDEDRLAQKRTPITDQTCQKPWLYRPKDIQSWWSNQHFNRINNKETSATSWVPCSKPIWFLEFGCPAIDRGSNAPNIFPDAKSAQSNPPPFSKGFRDDLIQKRVLESCFNFYEPHSPYFVQNNNPISPIYNDVMLDTSRIYLWAWDARPFPSFPLLSTVWSDGDNWSNGHWLTGRLEAMSLDDLIAQLLCDYQLDTLPLHIDVNGFMDGFVVDKASSLQSLIEPLCALFSFDVCFTSGLMQLKHRQHKAIAHISSEDCIIDKMADSILVHSISSSDLPSSLTLNVTDSAYDYRPISVLAQTPFVESKRQVSADLAVLTHRTHARQLADVWLNDLWLGRELYNFKLSHKYFHLEIGDTIELTSHGSSKNLRILHIEDNNYRTILARSLSQHVYDFRSFDIPAFTLAPPILPGPAHYTILDLALSKNSPTSLQYLAIYAEPWISHFSLFLQNGQSFSLNQSITKPANIGKTLSSFQSGDIHIFDHASDLIVTTPFSLSSTTEQDVLNGKNIAAIQGNDGAWEIFGFVNAVLIAPQTYKLSTFLRGLGGQDYLAARSVNQGAVFIVLDDAIIPLSAGSASLGIAQTWRLGPSQRDYGDSTYRQFETLPTNLSLKPLAPCHISASKNADNIIINFIRRSRIDADGWEAIDVPIGEDNLYFELDITIEDKIIRTLSSQSTQFIYFHNDQLSDFGSPPSILNVSIYQLSAAVGRGFPAYARLTIS